MHGGGPPVSPGKPLDKAYKEENVELVRAGCCNLRHHVQNALKFGVRVVVAVNQFATDTQSELQAVLDEALAAGASEAVVSNHWCANACLHTHMHACTYIHSCTDAHTPRSPLLMRTCPLTHSAQGQGRRRRR